MLRKETVIVIRVTLAEKARAQYMADRDRKSLSRWVRDTLLKPLTREQYQA
jgi:hypothetical protein